MNTTLADIARMARAINNHTVVITDEMEREFQNNIIAAAVAVYNENMFTENGDRYADILRSPTLNKYQNEENNV